VAMCYGCVVHASALSHLSSESHGLLVQTLNVSRGLHIVRVSFSCTPAPIPKGFQLKALMKTPSSYLFLDYLELTD
jgi:3-methyladenine DNA glycosylase AlkC